MDTRFWGPSGWRLLHLITFAAAADSLPMRHVRIFFKNLPFVLPCKFCRASLADYYGVDPIPTDPADLPYWLYRIHNRVNGKLRDQNLLKWRDPSWSEIKRTYTQLFRASCTRSRMIGWDFLFSVAFTTPCAQVASSPMANPPPPHVLHTPELRNRWGTITRSERLLFIHAWWKSLAHVLPFVEWRRTWSRVVPDPPSLEEGRTAITAWLYNAEMQMCRALNETAPHDTFRGLCSELRTFSSGCGARKQRARTCRSEKHAARSTLKQRRARIYNTIGGFL
jgi:hypothetical protein